MPIDLTMQFTGEMLSDAQKLENKALIGHWGTHFDVMDKTFPLEYTQCKGIVFDVRNTSGEITESDVDLSKVEKGMFVAFYTGFSQQEPYGTRRYFGEHPQLSYELIDALLKKGVWIIGVDFAGIRRTPEHIPTDRRCADAGTFVVENLCNLQLVLQQGGTFVANTYPMNFTQITGLPCRVIARV